MMALHFQFIFLSTLSLRRATIITIITICIVLRFLSTLSLRRATWAWTGGLSCNGNFYPRSPCGERLNCSRNGLAIRYFYPRSPCGERRMHEISAISITRFLSTLSLRRATPAPSRRKTTDMNFYPRSPCGERPRRTYHKDESRISIHALLAESDVK